MHAAVRYSALVLLSLTVLRHQALAAHPHPLAQQQEDEAFISQKIDMIRSHWKPPFVIIRSSQRYDRTVLGASGIYSPEMSDWEWIRLGCLPIEEIGPRLCEGLGGSILKEVASGKGGECGISLYLVDCE